MVCAGALLWVAAAMLALALSDGPDAVELGLPLLELLPLVADAMPVGVIVTERDLLAVPPVKVELAVAAPAVLPIPASCPAVTSWAVELALLLSALFAETPPLPPVGAAMAVPPVVVPVFAPPSTVPPAPPVPFACSVAAPPAPPVDVDVFVAVPLVAAPPS